MQSPTRSRPGIRAHLLLVGARPGRCHVGLSGGRVGHPFEHRGGVAHRTRHDQLCGEAGHHVAELGRLGHPPARGLQAHQPAGAGGDADGAAAVVRVPDRDHAGRHGRGGASARAAGGVAGIPGVARGPVGARLGGGQDAQLGRVRPAHEDESRLAEAAREPGVLLLAPADPLQEAHALVVGVAGGVAGQVLHHHGHALERPGRRLGVERLLEQRVDHGVELAVQRLHSLHGRLHQLASRYFARAHERGLSGGIQPWVHAARQRTPFAEAAGSARWPPPSAGSAARSSPDEILLETGSGFASFTGSAATRRRRTPPIWNRYRLQPRHQGPQGFARKSGGLRERARARDPDPGARVRRLRQRGGAVPRGRHRGGRVHQVPPPAGRVRPAPGRRPDDPGEAALRGHHARADGGLRRRGGALGAPEQGAPHHAPEHPAPPHPAARRRRGDPRARRGRPLIARGLRQHRPQRDRRPVGRRLRGRAVRPHALCGRIRPLLRPPPHHADDAAQGEDRLHRDRRGPRDHRHPRRRLHPAHQGRGSRLRDEGRRRHLDHAARGAHPQRLRARGRRRIPQVGRGGVPDLRPPGVAAQEPRAGAHQGVRGQVRDRRAAQAGRGGAEGRLGGGARLRPAAAPLHRRRGGGRAAGARRLREPQRRRQRVRALPRVQRAAAAPEGVLHGPDQGDPRRPHAPSSSAGSPR